MEQAIKKAIEGGYKFFGKSAIQIISTECQHEVFLDPLFWQALGKALGWKSSYQKGDPEWETMTFEQMIYRTPHALAMRLYEHIWEGKDAESFFNNLTNQTQ